MSTPAPKADAARAEWRKLHRETCPRCGARRVDQQIGLEATPDEYVARMVAAFSEVRRVLRPDGVVWLNIGDSYAATTKGSGGGWAADPTNYANHAQAYGARRFALADEVKAKDLLGIPWMLAFALRADGWYLRSDVIWSKPNPMPESVTDRPTSAHEHVFLLTRSARYAYDADAIREGFVDDRMGNPGPSKAGDNPDRNDGGIANNGAGWNRGAELGGRNKRNVWEIATHPYPEAHFATFPTKLVEPCLLAGTSPTVCGVCAAPWERIIERDGETTRDKLARYGPTSYANAQPHNAQALEFAGPRNEQRVIRTLGWAPTCDHDDATGRAIVLDPFAGSGTVGVVAAWYRRHFIGVELEPRLRADGARPHRRRGTNRPPRPAWRRDQRPPNEPVVNQTRRTDR